MHCSFCWKMSAKCCFFHNQDSEINAKTCLCSNMLQGVVWNLPYAKNWQSCCSASQVCRVHCKKVMLAGAQVCLVMTGDCPQVFLVAGWFELCAIIQKQPAADLYLLSKSQWSAFSSHLQAGTINTFLVLVKETHSHYWAVIQGLS